MPAAAKLADSVYTVLTAPAVRVYVAVPDALVVPVPSVAVPFRKLTVSPATAGVTDDDNVTVEPAAIVDEPIEAKVVVVAIAVTVKGCAALADAP